MMTIRTLALCAAIATACSHQQEAIQLRYKFSPGQTDRYKVELTVLTTTPDQPPAGKPVPVRGGGASVVKVDTVEPDGSAQVTATMENFKIGGRAPADGQQTSKYTISVQGVATESGAPKTADRAQKSVDPRVLARLCTILPPGPVKPGDSWKNQMPDPLTGAGSVQVTARFFRMESIDGVETARVHQSMSIPMAVDMPVPGSKNVVKISGNVTIRFGT